LGIADFPVRNPKCDQAARRAPRIESVTYDEEEELDSYIWRNYNISKIAHRAIQSQSVSAKQLRCDEADRAPTHGHHQAMKFVGGDQPVLESRENLGPLDHYRLIRKRFMEQFGDQVAIARCTRCKKIIRTPEARQCLWCGHAWREG